MSIIDHLTPHDFTSHICDTFGNKETDSSASWVIEFLQTRGQGWAPFKRTEIERYYRNFKGMAAGFDFNRIGPGEHVYASAHATPPTDRECIQTTDGVIGYRHICRNNHSIEIEDGICTVTDRFVEQLAARPDNLIDKFRIWMGLPIVQKEDDGDLEFGEFYESPCNRLTELHLNRSIWICKICLPYLPEAMGASEDRMIARDKAWKDSSETLARVLIHVKELGLLEIPDA